MLWLKEGLDGRTNFSSLQCVLLSLLRFCFLLTFRLALPVKLVPHNKFGSTPLSFSVKFHVAKETVALSFLSVTMTFRCEPKYIMNVYQRS